MKKIILSILSLSFLLTLNTNKHYAHAETTEVTYQNNAYQICEIQNNLTNLFLGNSIYNSSQGCIRLDKSIRVNNPSSKKLTFYFKFKEDLTSLKDTDSGSFTFVLMNDNGNRVIEIAERISNLSQIKSCLERDERLKLYTTSNEIFIEVDTNSFSDKITICGDEYNNTYDSFRIDMANEKLTIEKFMLYEGTFSSFTYSRPSVGIGSNSEQVYTNNDTIYYTINYDNRLSLEEIKQDIIAYDYYDQTMIIPSVELDEYTNAVEEDKLGTFSVKLKATDKANNSTILNLQFKIEDTTKPIYTGTKEIVIHYTDLPSNNLLNLTQYIFADDNHDGLILLDDSFKEYAPKMFEKENKVFSFSDVSGNTIQQEVSITISDNIKPIISGEDEISIYQYEYKDIDELLTLYSFTDEGSGIKESYLESNCNDFTKSGEYEVTLYAVDNWNNTETKDVKLTIKDGVGPVFFVKVSSLNVTNETMLSAEQVINTLVDNGTIKPVKYTKYSYITKTYEENYSKKGIYDTQIVCYDENGNKDYYLVKIEVKEVKQSNFFTRFYKSMVDFFKNLLNQIKEFFSNIFNFFKKD